MSSVRFFIGSIEYWEKRKKEKEEDKEEKREEEEEEDVDERALTITVDTLKFGAVTISVRLVFLSILSKCF